MPSGKFKRSFNYYLNDICVFLFDISVLMISFEIEIKTDNVIKFIYYLWFYVQGISLLLNQQVSLFIQLEILFNKITNLLFTLYLLQLQISVMLRI